MTRVVHGGPPSSIRWSALPSRTGSRGHVNRKVGANDDGARRVRGDKVAAHRVERVRPGPPRPRTDLGPLALVEIDTVSRALAGGDENSAADMGSLVRSLDSLRDRLGCHVSAIHHLGKDAARGPRGHSLLKAAVDTAIEVSRDPASRISTGSIVKRRDGATEG